MRYLLALVLVTLCYAPAFSADPLTELKRQIIMAESAIETGVNTIKLRDLHARIRTEKELAGAALPPTSGVAVDIALESIRKAIAFGAGDAPEGVEAVNCAGILHKKCQEAMRTYYAWLGLTPEESDAVDAQIKGKKLDYFVGLFRTLHLRDVKFKLSVAKATLSGGAPPTRPKLAI
jgi:hypothetical protein